MMKFNPYTLLILAVCFFSLPALSEIRWPEIPSKNKPLSFSVQTEYFRTHSNYSDSEGLFSTKYYDLPDENFFQYIAIHPRLSYSPLPYYLNLELFANNFYAASKTENVNRTVFRPTHIGGAFQIYHKLKTAYFGFELRGAVPLFFRNLNDEIILTDGAYFIEPGLWFLFQPSKMFYVYYNTAFRYRMSQLSGILFNTLGGVVKTRYTDAGMSVRTFISLNSNSQARSAEQVEQLLKTVNGGSYTFFSVKPSVLAWTAWMELKFKPVFTKIFFNVDTLGKNYAKGFSFGMVTKLQWSTKSSFLDREEEVLRFNFDDNGYQESSPSKKSSYFEEEEDPYTEDMNKELKKELKSLKY